MQKFSRIFALLLALVMIVSMFAACSKTPAETPAETPSVEPPSTDTPAAEEPDAPAEEVPADINETGALKLQWHQSIGIDTLFENPWHDKQSLYPYMVFESLLGDEPHKDVVSGVLASSYEVSADGLTYTLTLREGVKWHDGEAFDAEDVMWTLNAMTANPNSNYRGNLFLVEGYNEVVEGTAETLSGLTADGNTITIKLVSADPLFHRYLSNCVILPEHLLGHLDPAEVDSYEAYWSKPIGTGAYKIDEVSFPDYFTCVRNDDYWGEKATIKNVQFTSYAAGSNDAVVASMITGELDYAFGNSTNDVTIANNVNAQNPDMKIAMRAGNSRRYFEFNFETRTDGNNKADLLNPKVRQAFDMIIDKNAIADFYMGQATALSTFCHPGNYQYNDDIPLPQKDIEGAKALLDEAGFDYSQTYELAYYYTDTTTADVMLLLEQDFASAGITLKTRLLSGDTNAAIYDERNFDILYMGGGAVNPCDSYQYMCPSISADKVYIGLEDERAAAFEDLYAQYRVAIDETTKKDLADKLQMVDYENRYCIPVYGLNTIVMYNDAHVSIPADFLAIDGANYYRWDQWSLIG